MNQHYLVTEIWVNDIDDDVFSVWSHHSSVVHAIDEAVHAYGEYEEKYHLAQTLVKHQELVQTEAEILVIH